MPTFLDTAIATVMVLCVAAIARLIWLAFHHNSQLSDGLSRLTRLEVQADAHTDAVGDIAKRVDNALSTTGAAGSNVPTTTSKVDALHSWFGEHVAAIKVFMADCVARVNDMNKRVSSIEAKFVDGAKLLEQAAANSENAIQQALKVLDEVKTLRAAIDREVGERMQQVATIRTSLGGAVDNLHNAVRAVALNQNAPPAPVQPPANPIQ